MIPLGGGHTLRRIALGACGVLILAAGGAFTGSAADLPARSPAVAPQMSVAPAIPVDNLTYDERRTREMYRLIDKLRATTDPKERRALQLQILPLSGGCVSDLPQPAQAKNP
jgi:hypothetical protein